MARRNHTLEERVEAVKEYWEEGKDFSKLSEKYGTTAQVVRSWVKRYQEMGVAGLEDRRGKRLAPRRPGQPRRYCESKSADWSARTIC